MTMSRTTSAPRVAAPPLQGRRGSIAVLVLVTGQFMANLDTSVANVAVPTIRADLGATGAQLQLVTSGFVMAYAVLLITGARFGVLHGFRAVYLTGLALFTLSSLACGLAPTPTMLILARICQGAAAALLVPQVLTGIQLLLGVEGRARAFGWYAASLSAGAVAGQVLGGLLVTADPAGLGWRTVFLVNVPLGAVLLVLTRYAVPVLPPGDAESGEELDLVGVALLSGTVLLGVVPLVLGPDLHWPLWGWVALGAGAFGLGRFLAVERRLADAGGHPLVDPRLLAVPTVRWGLVSYGLGLSTYFSMLFVLALYLQQGLGHSALYSGLALVSWVGAFGVAGPLLRRTSTAAGLRSVGVVGPLVLAAAHAGISVSLLLGVLPGWWLMTLLGLGGLGLGLAFTAMLSQVTGAVAPERAPELSGLLPTTAQLSGVFGVATFGTAYLALAAHSPRTAFVLVTAAFAATAVGSAVLARVAMRGHPA